MSAWARLRVVVVVASLAPAGVARADVAPPDDYVDPCASMTFDATCRRCTSPEFKAPTCHGDARGAGLVERCSGWGYTMYCREGGAPTPTPPPDDRRFAPPPPDDRRFAPPPPDDRFAPPPDDRPSPDSSARPDAPPPDSRAPFPPPPASEPPEVARSSCSIGDEGGRAGLAALVLALVVVPRRRRVARSG